MSRAYITFQPEDKNAHSLILEVEYLAWRGSPASMEGPGEDPGCEIESVRLASVDCGRAFQDQLRFNFSPAIAEIIGALCLQADQAQIENLVMEAANEDARDYQGEE